jgi:UDP-3-O-acyl-N-acetylglucosamine deacetylase
MNNKQHTLKKSYNFKGKGLHTGKVVNMTLNPAPDNFGIKFKRVDLAEDAVIDALVDYVTTTARGTTLEKGEVKISTLEHLMATLYGLGVDNALITIDSQEVPILDGSAKPYVREICKDGLVEQKSDRIYLEIKEK